MARPPAESAWRARDGQMRAPESRDLAHTLVEGEEMGAEEGKELPGVPQ